MARKRKLGAAAALMGLVALLPWWRKKGAGVTSATGSRSTHALRGMTWEEFELLVGESFRAQGYEVTESGGGPDDCVDMDLRKDTETWLVQCRRWKAYMVDVSVVREMYGAMTARGATGAYVVTAGSFSNDAQAFASGRNVRLIDGLKLTVLLQQGRAVLAGKTSQL